MTLDSPQERHAGSDSRALIHIGVSRTGTTSFQTWAHANRESLLEQTGIAYYEGLFRPTHYEIPLLCLRPNRNMPAQRLQPDSVLDEWRNDAEVHIREQAARPATSLLISAEALSLLRHVDEVERLVDLLHPRQLWIVAVLREPTSYLRSLRWQMTKAGVRPSSYRESFAYLEDDSWLVDYTALADVYRSVLGHERVKTIPYEAALARDGSTIPGILEAFGINRDQLPPWQGYRLNATRSRTYMATRRMVLRHAMLRRLHAFFRHRRQARNAKPNHGSQ